MKGQQRQRCFCMQAEQITALILHFVFARVTIVPSCASAFALFSERERVRVRERERAREGGREEGREGGREGEEKVPSWARS